MPTVAQDFLPASTGYPPKTCDLHSTLPGPPSSLSLSHFHTLLIHPDTPTPVAPPLPGVPPLTCRNSTDRPHPTGESAKWRSECRMKESTSHGLTRPAVRVAHQGAEQHVDTPTCLPPRRWVFSRPGAAPGSAPRSCQPRRRPSD